MENCTDTVCLIEQEDVLVRQPSCKKVRFSDKVTVFIEDKCKTKQTFISLKNLKNGATFNPNTDEIEEKFSVSGIVIIILFLVLFFFVFGVLMKKLLNTQIESHSR